MPDFALQLTEIYPRTDLITTQRPLVTASLQDRVQSIVFFNRVLFSNTSIVPQYWDGEIDELEKERTYDVPGLPDGDAFDGIATFFSHVLLWRGSRLIWSDSGDFTLWYPVSNTITSLVIKSLTEFAQPAAGGETEFIYFDQPLVGVVEGQPFRNVNIPTVSYWTVTEVAPFGLKEYLIEAMTRDRGAGPESFELLYAGQKAKIYVDQSQVLPALIDSFVHPESDIDNEIRLKVTGQSSSVVDYTIFLTSDQLDLTEASQPSNSTLDVEMFLSDAKVMTVGDIVSIDILQTTGRDIWTVDFIDTANPGLVGTDQIATVTLRRGAPNPQTNFNQIAGRATWDSSIGVAGKRFGIVLTYQRWIEVESLEETFNIFAAAGATAVATSLVVDDGAGGSVFANIRDDAIIQNLATNEIMLVSPTPVSDTLTIVRGHLGTTPAVVSNNDTFLVRNVALIPFGDVIVEQYAAKFKTEGLTGRIPTGEAVPTDSIFETVDANDSGEIENVEPSIVGTIYNFVQIGEYGYLLKERSIQSIQFVGLDQGVFFIRSELTQEGMIGKYAFVKLNDDSIAILGNRDLYLYRGGKDYVPIARNYTIKLYKELDTDRRDEIQLFHNEQAREIWVIYPAIVNSESVRKVFIYNYEDNSCVVDDYSADSLRLTAAALAKPFELVTWNDLIGDWTEQQLSWGDYDGSGIDRRIIIGAFEATNEEGTIENDCGLLERHTDLYFLETDNNTRFDRGIPALVETADEDWGDDRRFKYLDEIYFTFDFEEPLPLGAPRYLYVSVGARDTSDATLRYSSEQRIEITGGGTQTTKVNIRMSGRYMRLRLRSDQPDTLWQIAKIVMYASVGGYE
jgi:hypothetical protein